MRCDFDFLKRLAFCHTRKHHFGHFWQKRAIQNILKARHSYHAFLLDGLTGSGKTEVYLQVMQEVLKQGKQVLLLKPRLDVRFGVTKISSRSGLEAEADIIGSLEIRADRMH